MLKSGKSTIEAHDNEEVSRQNALLRAPDNLSHAVRTGISPDGKDRGKKLARAQVAPAVDSYHLPRHIFGCVRGQK
jgi:hypothetical protein